MPHRLLPHQVSAIDYTNFSLLTEQCHFILVQDLAATRSTMYCTSVHKPVSLTHDYHDDFAHL